MKRLLLPDAADGSTPPAVTVPGVTDQVQPEAKPAPEAVAEGAPPPMSTIAVTGAKSEREIELETELEKERRRAAQIEAEKIDREKTICEMQDEHHRYRQSVEVPKPAKKSRWMPIIGSEE